MEWVISQELLDTPKCVKFVRKLMETFSMLLKKFKKKMLINAKNKYFFNHHTKIRLEKNSYLEKYFS